MTRGGFTRRRVEGRQRGVDAELVESDSVETESIGNDAADGDQFWPLDTIITSEGKTWDVNSTVSNDAAGTALQAACDDVTSNGWVYAPPRDYVQDLVLFKTDKPEVTVFGMGRQDARIIGETSHAIDVDITNAYRGCVKNIAAETSPGGGNAVDAFHVSAPSNSANFKFINCRATQADRDGFHVEDGAIEVVFEGVEASSAGDIDRNLFYDDGDYTQVWGGMFRVGGGPSAGVNNIATGPNSVHSTIVAHCATDPNVSVAGGPYNDLTLLGSKGVVLTFESGSSECYVEASRFSTVTNNGAASNNNIERRAL